MALRIAHQIQLENSANPGVLIRVRVVYVPVLVLLLVKCLVTSGLCSLGSTIFFGSGLVALLSFACVLFH